MSDPIPREALLSLRQVMTYTTYSQSEVYRRVAAGSFPTPRQLSGNRVAWRAGEVFDWIQALPPAKSHAVRNAAA